MAIAWLSEILDRHEVCAWGDGDILFRQGDGADCAYLLREGEVEVIVDTPLGSLQIATLSPPQMVGEIAMFCEVPRSATVIARGTVRAFRLTRDALIEATHRSPEAARSIISSLGQRLAGQNASVALLSTAARALGDGRVDSAAVARLLEEADRDGPLAKVFRNVVMAIEAKRMHEMELDLATRVQRAILPKPLVQASFSVEGEMRPAREVGGDFYDFFVQRGHHALFVIGDVSGKGVPASLFAASTHAAVRSLSLTAENPAEIVGLTNRFLAETNHENLFVTLLVGDLDLTTGVLSYCNAGHEAPYLLHTDGSHQRLPPTGPAVGIVESFDYVLKSARLAPGEVVFAVTDGVTDAVDPAGQIFGEVRLTALLGRGGAPAGQRLIAELLAALDGFGSGAEQFDDITCLALSYHPDGRSLV